MSLIEGFIKIFRTEPNPRIDKSLKTEDLNKPLASTEYSGIIDTITPTDITFYSRAYDVKNKTIKGIELTIETSDGFKTVQIPVVPSQQEQKIITGSNCHYIRDYYAYNEGAIGYLQGWDYELKCFVDEQKCITFTANVTV